MKINHFLKAGLLGLAFLITHAYQANAQLSVSSNSNAAALAAKLVGPGVTITNAVLNCPTGAAGEFSAGPGINEVGIGKGVLLTSGNVSVAAHPNDSQNATVMNGASGNSLLDALIPGYQTYDACLLEFDLEAIGNQVSFEYVFASEEYDEYYCSQYNDVFGFFVSNGPNPSGGTYNNSNIALIPGSTIPVAINTVGPPTCGANSPTPGGPGTGNPVYYRNMTGASTLQYDGKTVVLTAKVALKPCQKYRFKLGVADAGDQRLDSGVFLKEGSFQSTPPVINCPAAMVINNEPGLCAAKATYNPTVSADCPVTATSSPASGSMFPVGTTTVTCTATDQLNNMASCTFTVTVNDNEKPKITCPVNVTVSCETSTLPASVGSPTVTDNCGATPATSVDVKTAGSCTNDYTINRSWTARDVHNNSATCVHVIKVEDKTPPIITCPANTTVSCDTTVAATGLATATDNCDPSLNFSRMDVYATGDCDWFCIVERHWTAKDDCGNISQCVQIITKNTAPVIETALPLTLGFSNSTVTIPVGSGSCVVQWMPYSGTVPKGLKFDNATANSSCQLATNPIDAGGHIVNPLLGEAMKLKILVKLKPALGTTKLSTFACPLEPIIKQALAPNPDVNELLRVTDLALGNIAVIVTNPTHAMFLLNLLKCINRGKSVCNP